MPAIDSGRQRARLSRAHLDVVNHLLRGAEVPSNRLEAELELVESGLVRDGRPVDFLAGVTEQLTEAQISLDVEIAGRDGSSSHGAVLTSSHCWTVQGWPGAEEQEYALLDPRLLPTWLAATLGLSMEGAAEPAEDLETVLGALDAALAVRAEVESGSAGDGVLDPVRALAEVPGISEGLAEVLAFERRAWRVTCSWRTADQGVDVRAVAVIDSGPRGLWQRVLPEEPIGTEPLDPLTPVLLRRLSASQAFRAVGELVPRSTDR